MTQTGHAAFDVRHIRHGKNGTRADRASVLAESMREVSPSTVAVHARINPNIVPADSHLNVAMVNDGAGGFEQCTDREQVLNYGDARAAKVRRKMQERTFETTLITFHLPKTMCEEIPDFYPRVDAAGNQRVDKDGNELVRARYVARDRDEALRYFNDGIAYLAEHVLWGGYDAIHGFDINFDESTPHIQIMADTFAPHPEHEGALRACNQQMWGSHKEVRYPEDAGDKAGKQMSSRAKMRAYQQGMREYMHGLGYPVELELSARHEEKLSKESFMQLRDREAVVAADAEYVAAADIELTGREGLLDERTAQVEDREDHAARYKGWLDARADDNDADMAALVTRAQKLDAREKKVQAREDAAAAKGQEATRALAAAKRKEDRAGKVLQDAREEAETIVKQAKDEAATAVDNALQVWQRDELPRIKRKAEDEANNEASNITRDAENKAAEAVAKAETQARLRAVQEGERLKREAEDEAEAKLEEAQAKLEEAQEQAAEVVANAEKWAKAKLEAAEDERKSAQAQGWNAGFAEAKKAVDAICEDFRVSLNKDRLDVRYRSVNEAIATRQAQGPGPLTPENEDERDKGGNGSGSGGGDYGE